MFKKIYKATLGISQPPTPPKKKNNGDGQGTGEIRVSDFGVNCPFKVFTGAAHPSELQFHNRVTANPLRLQEVKESIN